MIKRVVIILSVSVAMLAHSHAQLNVPSDGSDGALNATSNTTIDLRLATTGAWNTPGNGNGVYDPDRWAVVFKYSSVTLTAATLNFINHRSNAPVVWLVQGDVIIENTTINLITYDQFMGFIIPGPGGFRGGRGLSNSSSPAGSAGFGPGGARYLGSEPGDAGYASPGSGAGGGIAYGNPQIVPLIGGSGGAGLSSTHLPSGTGGGAILIVAGGRIVLSTGSSIRAEGVNLYSSVSYGSGGSVRLVADRLEGDGSIFAQWSSASPGRVRIEVNHSAFNGNIMGSISVGLPGNPPLIWPPNSAPSVRIVQVAGQNAPSDPSARFDQPDMSVGSSGTVTIRIAAQNVPSNWNVVVRVVRFAGDDFTVNATRVSGNDANSVYEATLALPPGMMTLQVRASAP
ncbi:MAG: hypothetical protein KIT45_05660 [Fimbriimonadia bacterium]|nr:hypothetical protein [Fimbriimonadia bacterium]